QAKAVGLVRAIADFSQEAHPVANAIDPKSKMGWAVSPENGKPHVAVFELKDPIGFANGTSITIRLDQEYGIPEQPYPIGRFRIAVTTRQPPLSIESAPATPGRVVFSDDFESGAGKWTVTDGNYSIVSLDGSKRYRVVNLPSDDISRSTAG